MWRQRRVKYGLPSWAIEIRAGGAESQSPFVNHLVLRFFSLFPIFLSGFGFGVSGVFSSPLYLRQLWHMLLLSSF